MPRRIQRSISFSPEHLAAVDRMRDKLPGMSRSGIIAEMLDMYLPVMEDLLDQLIEARDQSGGDDQAVRDRLALWTGQQLLRFTDPGDDE
jgi:hypothetical protein